VSGLRSPGRALVPASARRRLKSSLAHVPYPRGSDRARVVVLCYHSVHPSKEFASATPDLFASQMAWLTTHCHLIPFSEVLQYATTALPGDEPAVAVTFDDGYGDNYDFAFPLLTAHGVPATFFLTIGLIEEEVDVVERFRALRRASYEDVRPLTWSQVLHMREAGMEFGTHTWSHPNLALLDDDAARAELARSKEVLERHLGESVTVCAYPFGKPKRHFTACTIKSVAATGYNYAAAVTFRGVRPDDEPRAIPRFFSTWDSLDQLRAKVLGRLDLIGAWQERAPMWLVHVVSPEDFRYQKT
jgi:peptidoglycan/xylan/chitin deacetylase (PgdA/CDA1 family)